MRPTVPAGGTDLLAGLRRLEEAVSALGFDLPVAERERGSELAARMRRQLNDYLLPRARDLEAPLCIVVGGSTGAGKSTLVNSLLGRAVSRAGVVRPTTVTPLLLHHPDDAARVTAERLLPSLARAGAGAAAAPGSHEGSAPGEPPALRPVPSDAVPRGVLLIDAPDIDSVSDANRALSRQLLDAADVWLFVTTANRYADAVPWEILERAAARRIRIAVALNRVPAGEEGEILEDLSRLLGERGLAPDPLITVREQRRGEDGRLPEPAVAPLRAWIDSLGADAGERARLAAESLRGTVASLGPQVGLLAAALREQVEHRAWLAEEATRPCSAARARVEEAISDGALLRGEVLSRWQDFVGTGKLFRRLESSIGRLRDRVGDYLRGGRRQAASLEAELETGLYRVIVEQAAEAAEAAQRAWHRDPAGRSLLAGEDLGHLPDDFPDRVQRELREWQRGIMETMAEEGAEKRQRARFLSAGLNAGAVVLMIVVFSMTGGLTGIEVGIAGGAGALGWKLLEAVFGEEAVRRMAVRAREDLLGRVGSLMEGRAEPFLARLPQDRSGALETLLEAGRTLDAASADAPAVEVSRRAPAADAPVVEAPRGLPSSGNGAEDETPNAEPTPRAPSSAPGGSGDPEAGGALPWAREDRR
ncbi:GTPase [Rothia halotolerans]|uniref:GTPase n=1 Tax=Rothia halotolerans TaxID=405770 RepID=UPI00101D432B|nr:GTPase [Rothia halotolerans]